MHDKRKIEVKNLPIIADNNKKKIKNNNKNNDNGDKELSIHAEEFRVGGKCIARQALDLIRIKLPGDDW